jgi:hypothetical protein
MSIANRHFNAREAISSFSGAVSDDELTCSFASPAFPLLLFFLALSLNYCKSLEAHLRHFGCL